MVGYTGMAQCKALTGSVVKELKTSEMLHLRSSITVQSAQQDNKLVSLSLLTGLNMGAENCRSMEKLIFLQQSGFR